MGETKRIVFEDANAMPAPTWHNLRMNGTEVEIPEGLLIAPDVVASGAQAASEVAGAAGAEGAFEQALAEEQAAWEREHPAPSAEELAARAELLAAEADATYGGTALSAYQAGADALEESRSLAEAFQAGVGEEAAAYLRFACGERIVVHAERGQEANAQVVISGAAGHLSAAAVDVVADADSVVNLSLVVRDDGPAPLDARARQEAMPRDVGRGDGTHAGAAPSPGITGTTLRVFAGANARVGIARTQALGATFHDIDDMGLFAAAGASIDVRQTVLGAHKTYTGLAADLRGDASRIDIATRYLGHGSQAHDFNYLVRHHGRATECDLRANGVLAGTSSKTLRGTIDLIRGAKGAMGSENETVLLVDEGVNNQTIPVILCNEDDVAGNHGATIGHVRDEQLFYLASRGLSREAAERMFVTAIVEQAALDAPDDASRDAVVQLGETVSPGFAALFDERD